MIEFNIAVIALNWTLTRIHTLRKPITSLRYTLETSKVYEIFESIDERERDTFVSGAMMHALIENNLIITNMHCKYLMSAINWIKFPVQCLQRLNYAILLWVEQQS